MRTARLRLHDLSSARSLFHPTIFLHIVSSYYLPMYSCHSHLAWFADPGQPQVNPILRLLDLIYEARFNQGSDAPLRNMTSMALWGLTSSWRPFVLRTESLPLIEKFLVVDVPVCSIYISGITFITFHPSAWHIANVSLTWSPNAPRPEKMPRPNLRSSNLIAPRFWSHFFVASTFSQLFVLKLFVGGSVAFISTTTSSIYVNFWFLSPTFIWNKLAKLGDAIAISKSETLNHSLTDPLTDRVGARRCYYI